MIFQAAEHFERLQAVNAQLLEKIVIRSERTGRHFEVLRRQIEDFLRGLFQCAHGKVNLTFPRQERKLAVRREVVRTEAFSLKRWSEQHEAAANPQRYGFGSGRRAKLAKNRGDVELDRMVGDGEFC